MIGPGLLFFVMLYGHQAHRAEAWQVQRTADRQETTALSEEAVLLDGGKLAFEGTLDLTVTGTACVLTFEEIEAICAAKGVKIEKRWLER